MSDQSDGKFSVLVQFDDIPNEHADKSEALVFGVVSELLTSCEANGHDPATVLEILWRIASSFMIIRPGNRIKMQKELLQVEKSHLKRLAEAAKQGGTVH